MPSFCAQCGAALGADARFCEECGAPLGGAAFKPAPSSAQGLRRRGWLWVVVGGGAVFLIVGGMFFGLTDWLNPDARANKLFVEASHLLQSAQEAETASYAEAFKLYQAALAKVEKVTTQYPSSQLAVQLTQGMAKIGPYTITEFQETVRKAEVRAKAEESPLACALFIAGTIEDIYFQANALTDIAGKYVEAGQKAKALEVLSQALQVAETVKDFSKAWALRRIAGKYAEVRQYDQAFQVAKAIEDVSSQALTLTDIAGKYVEAGQKAKASEILSQALQVVTTIEDANEKAWALAEIAKKYAQVEQYDQAFQIANQLAKMGKHGHSYRGSVFVGIARQYAQAGQYDQALQVAKMIENADIKTRALVQIAGTYAQAEPKVDDSARKILHEIIRTVDSSSGIGEQEGFKLETVILGKWQNINHDETIEFFRDGTVNLVSDGSPSGGEYKVVDDTHLRLHLGGLAELAGPMIWKFSVSRNQLVLNLPDGKVAIYRRAE